ncbi:peptidyl-prolyl cis-trans isomerase [Polymorphobacter glacialis]|uniref:Peptidyl-prolyl cis-trans isomerase n=1 Tax=Sandarakinorhabdus glacialis TaxID=1614636 RepID=A0A917E4Z1_9SPHN|nr:peptidylprolyl isomerase [Polymorphobacter glacialis]GGE01374.1 peptidyl-prolyl cis-trans isomerase [Polymorphobacter glacialis]
MKIALLAIALLSIPALAAAQTAPLPAAPLPAPAPAPPPRPTLPRVTLQTPKGPIVIALDIDKAPKTAANFLRYVTAKKFDGTSFYRALSFPRDTPLGLIQGGIRGISTRSFPPIAHEATSLTGLTHDDGAVSMARTTPGTAQGDFFIIIGKLDSLDADFAAPGFAVFGHVVEGMDIVRAIQASPVSPTAGEGAMKGQILAAPVAIITATKTK